MFENDLERLNYYYEKVGAEVSIETVCCVWRDYLGRI